MKTENTITENYRNLMTGEIRAVTYTRRKDLEGKNGLCSVYESEGHFYTHGFIGWVNIDKYIN